MDKKIIIKALLNGIISWLVLTLLFVLIKDQSFVQALTASYVIAAALAAAVGSYIGFVRKAKK